jgi:hypothetical protein
MIGQTGAHRLGSGFLPLSGGGTVTGTIAADQVIVERAATANAVLLRDPAFPAGRSFTLLNADTIRASGYFRGFGGVIAESDWVVGPAPDSFYGYGRALLAGDIEAAGGYRQLLMFGTDATPAGAATAQAYRPDPFSAIQTEPAIRAGWVVGLAVKVSAADGGGTQTVQLTVNGAPVAGATCTLAAGDTAKSATFAKDTYVVAANNLIGAQITGVAASTGGKIATISVQLEG